MLIYVFSPSRVALAVTIVSRVSLICADILLVYRDWAGREGEVVCTERKSSALAECV